MQQLKVFGPGRVNTNAIPRNIGLGSIDTRDQAGRDRVANAQEMIGILCVAALAATPAGRKLAAITDTLRPTRSLGQCWKPVVLTFGLTVLDHNVAIRAVSCLIQHLLKAVIDKLGTGNLGAKPI